MIICDKISDSQAYNWAAAIKEVEEDKANRELAK
jgi:hypothetical protein